MAALNLLTRNPMVIGSPFTSSYKSQVASTLGTLFTLLIEKIYWKNPANAGDQFIITDPGSGQLLADAIAPSGGGAFFLDWTARPKQWQDFYVGRLDSGTLEIFTKAG